MFLFIALAVVLIIGNALILLRTAKKPYIPKDLHDKPLDPEDSSDW